MNRRRPILLFGMLLLLGVLILPPGTLFAATSVPKSAKAMSGTPIVQDAAQFEMPTDQIILKYKTFPAIGDAINPESAEEMQRLSDTAGISLTYVREMSGDAHVLGLPSSMPLADVQAIAERLNALPEVAYAEPDAIMVPMLAPNDPRYGDQWHYFAPGSGHYGINAPAAWDITTGSSSIIVAVVDTGITNHADLSGRTVPGHDFISNIAIANDGDGRDNNPSDPGDWVVANECFAGSSPYSSSWHGTHTAGTIGAASNNNVGVAGVNWGSRILPVRALGKCGGTTSDIVDGMRWSAGLPVPGVSNNSNVAKVLNLSLGGTGSCSMTYQDAINAIIAAGSTIVVSAGNSNADASGFQPANCIGVITVAATNRNGSRAYYSNFGGVVEISAPGGETTAPSDGILSTLNTGAQGPVADTYAYYQGTSMSAPHVAGVVSLMLSRNPALTPGLILSIMQSTVTSFPGGSTCTTSICGSGIVNAGAAVTAVPTTIITKTYLPLILRNYSSLGADFVNGGFEQGTTGWTQYSTHGWPVIVQSFPGSVAPHSGTWAAWLGGDYDDTSYVEQRVTVPAARPYVRYYHWIASADLCGYDFARVTVNGAVLNQYDLCGPDNTAGWVTRSVDLSAYAGQSVRVRISVTTNGSLNSNMFVDDVSFQATVSGAPEAEMPGADPQAAETKADLLRRAP